MSLTDKTYKQLAGLASQQESFINEFIFAELSDKQLGELTENPQRAEDPVGGKRP